MKLGLTIVALGVVLASANAYADLTGDTIHATYIYPDSSTVYQNLGTFTVPGGGNNLFGIFDYTVIGSQISISATTVAFFDGTAFNGFEFSDISQDPGISGMTLDPSTTAPVNVGDASFTSHTFALNFTGQSWTTPGETAVFDLLFQTSPAPGPIPGAGLLSYIALGLVGLGSIARKRSRSHPR
jgi:hypothetical protein